MSIELLPTGFYAVLVLLGVGIAVCVPGLRQGWGLPGLVVLLTVGAWYVGDALYNDYQEYYWEFGKDTLENAWWQVALFLMVFLLLVRPMHDLMNARVSHHQSFAIKSYEKKLVNEGEVQRQIDRVFAVLLTTWIVLTLIALSRVQWDFAALFAPYLAGYSAHPWARGRIGGQYDALISLAQYLQIFLTAAFGLIWAVSHNPRTRWLAGICFILSAPFFLFGRARNTMLAVVTPGLLAWVMIRLQTTWLMRGVVMIAAFLGINFWMLFVLENRDIQIVRALQSSEAFDRAAEGEHKGLNMFQELGYINHFMKLGAYQPNWGERYWAEIVNPIPRGLWPGKPVVGLDYAAARGMDQGGVAEGLEEGVAATISTGMIGQGVVNFGRLFGPMFAALLMALWVALLARQDLQAEEHPARFLLYALGIILTFNMGRDITFIVTYPFFFGYALVYYLEKKRGGATGGRGVSVAGVSVDRWEGGRRSDGGRRGGSVFRKTGVSVPNGEAQQDGGTMGPRDGRDLGTTEQPDHGTVRTMPGRVPKRVAAWMPRRVRQQVAEAARSAAEEQRDQGTKGPRDEETVGGRKSEVTGQKEQQTRPRQVGVPFRNYRRYRG